MRYVIETNEAPKAIGPYSQGIKAGGFLFVSGQIAIDPATQNVVPGDIKVQTERSCQNRKAILEAAGTDLESVVKSTVFLRSMADTAAMTEAYRRHSKHQPPACLTVPVA